MILAVVWYECELYLTDKDIEYNAGESIYTPERGNSKRLEERSHSGCCHVASFCAFSDEHLNAINGIFLPAEQLWVCFGNPFMMDLVSDLKCLENYLEFKGTVSV